jgi:hypothetical protein
MILLLIPHLSYDAQPINTNILWICAHPLKFSIAVEPKTASMLLRISRLNISMTFDSTYVVPPRIKTMI